MTHSSIKSELRSVLESRGFVHQCTDMDGLDQFAAKNSVLGYIGFDLTASSLHVGSLIQLMALRWMERCGHQPVVLLGTSTTMVGDPTGKSSARPMLDETAIADNRRGIKSVISRITGLSDESFIENTWHQEIGFLDFMRRFGRHFSANRLLAMDALKSRVESRDGLSVLELIYPMLQSIDFYELNERDGVSLQIGGSDQWGNITTGTDLIRRLNGGNEAKKVFGLTTPLFTNSAGEKMGKTTSGTVWLDPELTSPHQFFQFWMNEVEDSRITQCFYLFTEMSDNEIGIALTGGIVEAKRTLAAAITEIVHPGHGKIEMERSKSMFSDKKLSGAPQFIIDEPCADIASALVATGLAKSMNESTRLANNGGVRINGEKISNVRVASPTEPFVLSVGKRAYTIILRPKP